MHINNSAQLNQIYKTQSPSYNMLSNADRITENKALTTDTVDISNAGLNAKKNWQEIAKKFDVSNISQNEMGDMVSNLVDNKLISSTDSLFLMAPTSMNQDPEIKYDLLESMRKRLDSAIANGNTQDQIKKTENAFNIIEQLKNLSN
ncbi:MULTISPECIES: hypothetical protein [Alteromonadales]|jgi:hypothetical protein|uniref:hypothetical protein n=1 Tax=Alteromonadales TaxID=135622 RepID=UPI0011F2DB05|nr:MULTISPECIES: hypothetical protein [Alteromonadales]KAA1160877.1 hypothetical protein EU511_08580 [Pseudoalteromonas distincta]MDO6488622.1 hypothetical protein [Colwellia sp. 6_MG-2023]